MTFYWWSHWFWITILCSVVVVVHTYPSQESTLLYNNHQQENTKKLVTRLYQTSTITWTTNVPNYFAKTTNGEGNLKLQHVAKTNGKLRTETTTQRQVIVPAQANVNDNEEEVYFYDYDVTEDVNQKLNLEQVEVDLERKEQVSASLNNKKPCHEVDVKRSAEDQLQNKTAADATRDLKLFVTPTTAASLVETNNYTNFTNKNNLTSTNAIAALLNATIANTTTTTTTTINTSDNTVTAITNATTQIPQVPSTPKIVKAQIGKFDWFNSVGGHLPPTQVTTDAATDNNNEQQQPPHRIPFTLENVNKPDDLKREEGEHRTRKSKGLSSDYKINPYINYSSDSKNLLTRSAVTTVNEYDSEESNISSEALSVQRAYFMDVGAISAICFTVFGICCTVGTVGIVLYRRRFLNKPQALSEPDSSVYIDDSTMRVSDNSDEMYSLDNDSFLNSLEAMTIQNYWTDTVKHTKL